MTHKQKVLALLRDGRPHTHHELYQLGCVAHSRVSDLRRDGYRIECWPETVRGERVSMYRLLGGTEEGERVVPSPASVPPSEPPVSPTAESGESDGAGGSLPPAQLALSIPRSAYEVAA